MNILEYQEFCKRLDDPSIGNKFKLVGDKGSVDVEWLDLDMCLIKLDYFGKEKFFLGRSFCEPYMTGVTVEPKNEVLKILLQPTKKEEENDEDYISD